MPNVFDQFDSTGAPDVPAAPTTNPFDIFDAQQQTTDAAPVASPHTIGQKIGFGIGDIAKGISQSFAHQLPVDPYATMAEQVASQDQSAINGPLADADLAQREQTWQQHRAATGDTGFEWGRLGGNIIGAAPIMAAMAPAAPSSFLGALGIGAGTGAVNAGLQPVTSGNYNSGKVGQIAMGTGTGAVGGGVGYGVGRLIGGAPAPTTDYGQDVAFLQSKGVPLTPGQLTGPTASKIEDVAQPFSAFGQRRAIEGLNRAAYNEGAAPVAEAFGEQAPTFEKVGFRGVKDLGDYLSDKYDIVKGNIALNITPEIESQLGQVATEVGNPRQEVSNDLQKIITKHIYDRVGQDGVLTGNSFKDAEEVLTSEAKNYMTGSPDDRKLAQGIYDTLDTIRQGLAEQNPEYAPKLQALNKGWAVLTRIEGAVKGSSDNGVFTPSQLQNTVRTMDNAVRHRAFARGEALLQPLSNAAKNVLGNTYPNSGTAWRNAAAALTTGGSAGMFAGGLPGAAAGIGAVGSTGLAYTPWGQDAVNALLGPRSTQVPYLLGRALQNASPMLGAGAPLLLGH